MSTRTIEFDTTEMVKLISICNTAISVEKTMLAYLPEGSDAAQHSVTKIAAAESLKKKIKNALIDDFGHR